VVASARRSDGGPVGLTGQTFITALAVCSDMTRSVDAVDHAVRSPGDWPTEPEREYARRQADLAAHYGVDVESRTVETESAGRVHYLVAGDPDGDPVVLVHGVAVHAATWLPLAGALADDYRLYVPDRPGRGLSAAPSYRGRDLRRFFVAYLVDLCEALGLDRPHVVANSLGGLQSFLLALDHDRVDRLCLVGAPAGLSREFSLFYRLSTVRGVNRLLFWLLGRGDPLENARRATGQFVVDDAAIPTAYYEALAAAESLPGRAESLRSLTTAVGSFGRFVDLYDIGDEVRTIERPTCFVWGTEDAFWPPELGHSVAEDMADATVHELDEHDHMPWLEPGSETARRVRAFLDG
jgi:2-hydroxymuconate-semialdehyde hydrolase